MKSKRSKCQIYVKCLKKLRVQIVLLLYLLKDRKNLLCFLWLFLADLNSIGIIIPKWLEYQNVSLESSISLQLTTLIFKKSTKFNMFIPNNLWGNNFFVMIKDNQYQSFNRRLITFTKYKLWKTVLSLIFLLQTILTIPVNF